MQRLIKSRWLTAALVGADAAAFAAVWFGAYAARDYLGDPGRGLGVGRPINAVDPYVSALAVFLPFQGACAWYNGLYDHRGKINGLNQASKIVKTFMAGVVGGFAVAYLFKDWDLGRAVLAAAFFGQFLWLWASRSALRGWKQGQARRGIGLTAVAVLGVGRTARRAMDRIVSHREGGYRFAGFIDPRQGGRRRRVATLDGHPVLGTADDLPAIARRHGLHEVIIAVPAMPQGRVMDLVLACEGMGVGFKIVSNLFQVITDQVKIDMIDELPVVHLRDSQPPPMQAVLRRALDLVVAGGLLAVSALPMAMIALAVRLDSPGPALFFQTRVGLRGRPFRIAKFRTMRTDAAAYAAAPGDPDDPRVTRLGRFLRRYSLDEFPQLFNVIQGSMSMVGPRPEMPFLVEKYEPWQRRRLDVKPGVTGLWQIVGRKNLPLSLNLEYDFYYIKNQSLMFDLAILVKTVPAVLFGRGAF